jgi:hypothetical protein
MAFEEKIQWVSRGMTPGLDVVEADPACLDGLLEKEALLEERAELAGVVATIPKIPPPRAEVLEAHRASYSAALQRYAEGRLARFVSENLTSRDPFGRSEDFMKFFFVPWPRWELYEAALNSLPDEAFGTADESERQAEAAKIRGRLAAIDRRLTAINCPPFLRLDRNGIMADVRAEFADHWRRIQARCSAPCDPQGFELAGAPEWTKDAYRKLGIGAAVSKSRNALLPAAR